MFPLPPDMALQTDIEKQSPPALQVDGGPPPPDLPSDSSSTPSSDVPLEKPTSTPDTKPASVNLRPAATRLITASARQAESDLKNFSKSPANPWNWPNRKRWGLTIIVALSGFISTFGSSIGVPGIHGALEEFGIDNEQVGVLITTGYVLGLG